MNKTISLLLSTLLLSGCYVSTEPTGPADQVPSEPVAPKDSADAYVIDSSFDGDRWLTDVSRTEVIETALAKTHKYLDSRKDDINYNLVEVHIDPTIPEKHHGWIDRLGKDAMLASPGLKGHFDVIIGMDADFLHSVVAEKDLEMPIATDHSGSRPCPYSYGGCTSATSLWAGWANQPLDSLDKNVGIARHVLHEAMHSLQDDMDPMSAGQIPPREMENFRPVWFVEGSAEFWSYALADHLDVRKYGHDSERIEYKPLAQTEEWGGNDTEPYEWGQVAMEYMIAHKGFEAYLDVYSNLRSGMHFDTAFENAAGISLTEFYTIFDGWAVEHVVG